MEAGVMDELGLCREEKDILKQKLHIHLDRWTLDKIGFADMAAKVGRQIGLKEAEKSYETALKELRLGSQQQQLLVLKMKLDSALEDMELTEFRFSALNSQLQQERKWHDSLKETVRGMKAKFAWEKSKIVTETERKMKHLQKLLGDRVQSHKAEVEQIEGKHARAVNQLKKEIKHLVSRDADAKSQQLQWSVERKQLQALARERDDLRAMQEQRHKDQKQLHTLLRERDYLTGEVEKQNSLQKETQAIKDERDRLLAERDRFILREREIEELLQARDDLNTQPEDYASYGEDQGLMKENDRLKYKLDLSNAQRQGEVSALIRERDFVWSQMKNLDEDYETRIKKLSEQSMLDRRETERLKNEIKGAHVANNEMMVEMTILKLNFKQVEDLAIQKQRVLEAKLQELQSILERVKEENQTLVSDALKKESLRLELSHREGTLERQLDPSYQGQGAGAVGDGAKEVPEVLNAGDDPALDQDIIESQIEQATQVCKNDERQLDPSVEVLRRENENLRRETENLKVLYAELEDALRKKPQKPAKVTSKANHRDPTSRNLKLELEAAANSCAADESPSTDVRRKEINPGNQKLDSGANLFQRTSKGVSSKSGREESRSSEKVKVPKKNRRRLKGLATDGKTPSDENAAVPSPKKLRPRTRIDYSDAADFDPLGIAGQNGQGQLKKRKRVKEGDVESTKSQRPPLHPIYHNQRSSTKSAGQTSSSSQGPLPESSKKSLVGSPTKTSKVMVNYFSNAFNVPKLKTPVHVTD